MSEFQKELSEDIVRDELEAAGARVRSRSGRNEHYGSPRDFSFEVRALFDNGLGLQVIARQFNYREAWEEKGRVNDLVDVSLLYQGQFSELPKGYEFFQGSEMEEEVDFPRFQQLIETVKGINPKLFVLQELTGDL
ncbi:MAG: hypothetical protein C0622_14470 [Desulfuromonas sp.]|nr:MAG: hypothetical protein C0622_14470 [Desulfuromonas sp.]